MKRIFVISIILLLSVSSFAENYRTALGIRLGATARSPLYGANFKYFFTNRATSAIELFIDYQADDLILNSFFEFHKESRKSSRQVTFLNYYAGIGFLVNKVNEANKINHLATAKDPKVYFGPALIFGLEVGIPKTPLSLGFDVKPMYNIVPKVNQFSMDHRYDYKKDYVEVGASLRYTF